MTKQQQIDYQNTNYLHEMVGRLFTNIPGFVYRCLYDEYWTMEFMSEGCLSVSGYTSEELVNNKVISYQDVILSEDREKVSKMVQRGLDEDKQFSIEYRIKHKSGEIIWVWERGVCITNNDDEITHIEGYITEINERKKNEIELQSSKKMYQDLVELSPDGIIIVDLKGRIHNVNNAFCAMSGYKPEDFNGKLIFKIPTMIRSKTLMYKSIIKSVFSGKKVKDIFFHFKDINENIKLGEGRVTSVDINGENMIMGIIRDITDQDDERRSLINSKMKTEALLNASPDIMFVFDKDGMILDYKADSRDLFFQEKSILSMHISNILPHDVVKITLQKIQETLSTGKMSEFTYDLVIPHAGKKYFEARIIESGQAQVTAIIRDVTKRTNMEKSLIEAKEEAEENNRLKSAFLANMNHEIRTPMNAIMGFSSLLKKTDDKEKQQQYLDLLNTSSDYLLHLIDDVLLYSRLQSEKISLDEKDIELESFLNDLYHTVKNSMEIKEFSLELMIPNECKGIKFRGDREKIFETLIILLNNSIKYTAKGFVRIGVSRINDKLRFYVQDTGIGIPEKDKDKVFQRFYRSQKVIEDSIGGTGLGLSIAQELMKIMKTEILFVSTEGQGSNFYFDLPYKSAKPVQQDLVKENTKINNLSDIVLLVAEDDEASIFYMKEIIEGVVKEMNHAKNGQEAVDMVKQKYYDCILMDIKMPVMNGLEATRLIKTIFPEIPIIAQTAFTQSEEKKRIMDSGADAYISKPINPKELVEIMSKLCLKT